MVVSGTKYLKFYFQMSILFILNLFPHSNLTILQCKNKQFNVFIIINPMWIQLWHDEK